MGWRGHWPLGYSSTHAGEKRFLFWGISCTTWLLKVFNHAQELLYYCIPPHSSGLPATCKYKQQETASVKQTQIQQKKKKSKSAWKRSCMSNVLLFRDGKFKNVSILMLQTNNTNNFVWQVPLTGLLISACCLKSLCKHVYAHTCVHTFTHDYPRWRWWKC